MCMDKRNEFGERTAYFLQMKRLLRLSKKNLQFCELRYPMCEEVQILQLKLM